MMSLPWLGGDRLGEHYLGSERERMCASDQAEDPALSPNCVGLPMWKPRECDSEDRIHFVVTAKAGCVPGRSGNELGRVLAGVDLLFSIVGVKELPQAGAMSCRYRPGTAI